jgi:hypothetical protein
MSPSLTDAVTRGRGRPADPRLTGLDDLLVSIVAKHERITVRGVFYQAVNVKAVEKTEAAVGLIGRRLLLLRRSGRIPYSRIVDESRIVYGLNRYGGLADLAEDAAELYRRDYWRDAEYAVQIWVEKRGLAGLLKPTVCHKWGLDLYVAGGQFSESYLYTAGREIADGGKGTYVYAMTDFDPGGETIFNTLKHGSRKAPGGLSRFTDGVPVQVQQIALTEDQVTAWDLPTRPAKKTEKRSGKFIEEHGDVSTELDAIEPERLIHLVEDTISLHMPREALDRLKLVEEAERESVRSVLAALAGEQEPEDESK